MSEFIEFWQTPIVTQMSCGDAILAIAFGFLAFGFAMFSFFGNLKDFILWIVNRKSQSQE